MMAVAKLCRDCGFGVTGKNCVLCGRPTLGKGIPAHLCSDCSYGDKKNRCVKCGKAVLSTNPQEALLCVFCASYTSKKESCARCGKHIYAMNIPEQ